jgi:hypothetical protein
MNGAPGKCTGGGFGLVDPTHRKCAMDGAPERLGLGLEKAKADSSAPLRNDKQRGCGVTDNRILSDRREGATGGGIRHLPVDSCTIAS